jgi:hypothetical protein
MRLDELWLEPVLLLLLGVVTAFATFPFLELACEGGWVSDGKEDNDDEEGPSSSPLTNGMPSRNSLLKSNPLSTKNAMDEGAIVKLSLDNSRKEKLCTLYLNSFEDFMGGDLESLVADSVEELEAEVGMGGMGMKMDSPNEIKECDVAVSRRALYRSLRSLYQTNIIVIQIMRLD